MRLAGDSGLRVSRLGLGTLTWGRDTGADEAGNLLTAFVEAGGTLIDTAAAYGGGASEELIGSLLGRLVPRSDVVLCTKAGVRRRRPDGAPDTDTSRSAMLASLDASLRRLGTDHVDIWLAQGWSLSVPLAETLSALAHAVSSGRARYAGICNFSGWQTARAVTLGRSLGGGGAAAGAPVVTQVEYSLVQRGVEREVVPACTALGLGVLAWSPLGRGVLTGKYRSGTPADSRAASAHLSGFVAEHLDERAQAVVDAVCTAAEGLGRTPLEVALAWVRDQPGVTSVLAGPRTTGQLQQVLASEQVELPEQIRSVLNEVSTPDLGYPEAF